MHPLPTYSSQYTQTNIVFNWLNKDIMLHKVQECLEVIREAFENIKTTSLFQEAGYKDYSRKADQLTVMTLLMAAIPRIDSSEALFSFVSSLDTKNSGFKTIDILYFLTNKGYVYSLNMGLITPLEEIGYVMISSYKEAKQVFNTEFSFKRNIPTPDMGPFFIESAERQAIYCAGADETIKIK